MPKKFDPEVKDRAVRMVLDRVEEAGSVTKAVALVSPKVDVGRETLRRWVSQHRVDAGLKDGPTSDDLVELRRLRSEVKRLREDNELLRKASNFLRGGARPPQPMIMGFIDQMRAEGHAVESVCRVLRQEGCQIAARTYRAWRHRSASARDTSDAVLLNVLHDLVGTPEGLYGRRKMTAWLRRQGHQVGAGRVDRLMRVAGMNGVRRGRPVRTTIPAKDGHRAGDLLNRDFTAAAPNTKWVADFTYVRTWAGFVYVAFVLDCYSQKVVAWHAATSKTTPLVLTPLRIALWERDRAGHPVQPGELIAHNDAGSQYTSLRFAEHLAAEGIAASIGTVADAYDNALMECVIGLYKTECITTTIFHDSPYKTIADVEYATAGWVEWYNNRRLHSSLAMTTPAEYETAYYANLNRELAPA
ncbi:IS3 family transposase [Brevibacterium sp.]|uniref:IS3 family transposase n=1 Tax=Brevibacterium sp. TaxID=1701 RepID=UPI000EC3CAB7|nr:IS3 family transposase [Brevibacterium sp.]HCG54645.1 IS3 family transposase [Brevibacterium sp.]